jgi:Tfp pilus assembly protein PilF
MAASRGHPAFSPEPHRPEPEASMSSRRAFALVLGIVAACPAIAAPVRPSDDATVLLTLPAGRSASVSELLRLQAELSKDRRNLDLAVRTARLAITEGRAFADPRRYGEAEAALAPWWSDPSPPEQIRVLRAVIRQALHDFPAALADLDAVLEQAPKSGQARLTRAFVRLVVGDISGAREDCRTLPASVGAVAIAACRARVAALAGADEEGYALLSRAVARDAEPAVQRFALAILADIALGLGRDEDAASHFAAAAAIGQPDVPLLAAMADRLLDRDRPGEALALLEGRGEADALLLRRAIAAKRTGDARLDGWAATLEERFAAAQEAGVRLHLREEARFRLDVRNDAAAALPLAVENWRSQKEIADALLVLECALAADAPGAARDVVGFVRGAGIADRRVAELTARLGEIAP